MGSVAVRNWLAGAIGLGVLITAVITNNSIVDHPDLAVRVVIDTSVAIIGSLVAVLVYGRYRRSGDLSDVAIACAVALLAWVHTLFGTVPDLISPDSVGNGVSERFEVWGTLAARIMAAGFLIAAARSRRREDGAVSWTLGSGRMLLASVVAGSAAVAVLATEVPITRNGLLTQASWPQSSSSVLQLVGGLLFFVAFLLLSKRAQTDSDPFLGWIAVGCVFATFAMCGYGLLPAGGANWLRSGDVLRFAAVCAWAVGAVVEIVSYWNSVAASARLEARRAVAVDLHDGLAQELALLSAYTHLPPDQRATSAWIEELRLTAERALAESRRAITVLTHTDPRPLDADLGGIARDVSGTDVGIRVEVDDDSEGIDLAHRESIVRIVREAVTNAVRHGHARNINIRLDSGNPSTLRVLDDGSGFDVAGTAESGRFGVLSMQETAQATGGTLEIYSAPGSGTTVEVQWA